MATITDNRDGSLTVTLNAIEAGTAAANLADLESYMTQWLTDRTKELFNTRFAQLSAQDQADILAKFAQ
jgi:hypothetical protein